MNWDKVITHGAASLLLGGVTSGAMFGLPHDLAGWLKLIAGALAVLVGNQAGLWATPPDAAAKS